MNLPDLPDAAARARWARPPEQTWVFAKSFGVTAFLFVGGVVFLSGYRAAMPPPLKPGQANCGLAILGGYITMFLIAPAAAVISSLVGAVFGAAFDRLRCEV